MTYADVGSIIIYKDLEFGDLEEKKLVEIVNGSDEISIISPIGCALWGSKVGEIVQYEAPGGLYRLEVVDIKNGVLKNVRKEKTLKAQSVRDFSCIFSGLTYGSNSKTIYEGFCRSLGWDISQSGKFGKQGQPLFAEYADSDRTRDIWFLSYWNSFVGEVKDVFKNVDINSIDVVDSLLAIDYISQDKKTIVEFIEANKWLGVPQNKERVVFAKNKDVNSYEFLGVFELVECSNDTSIRIYKLKSDVYPIGILD